MCIMVAPNSGSRRGEAPYGERSDGPCRQVTDGHLVLLAAASHGRLVTLDRGIPGALLIPEPNGRILREPAYDSGAYVVHGCGDLEVVFGDQFGQDVTVCG
jgi:hypothetical protein